MRRESRRSNSVSIAVPSHRRVLLSADFGGSLIKVGLFIPWGQQFTLPQKYAQRIDRQHSFGNCALRGSVYLLQFRSSRFDQFEKFVLQTKLNQLTPKLMATGGGTMRHAEKLAELFGEVIQVDEMESLVTGLSYLVTTHLHEAFHYAYISEIQLKRPSSLTSFSDDVGHENQRQLQASPSCFQFRSIPHARQLFPYLLCNIGSGVSLIKVTGPGQYQRVGGSSFGGGTFWGLCSLFYRHPVTFEQLLNDALNGSSSNMDLLVREIYGSSYSNVNLDEETIAASFGKAMNLNGNYDRRDVANSLLKLLCLNASQLAVLTAKINNIRKIYYGGFFIRKHPVTMYALEFGTAYWSNGRQRATFLAHEGYLGAIGTLVSPNSTLYSHIPLAQRIDAMGERARYLIDQARGSLLGDLMDDNVSEEQLPETALQVLKGEAAVPRDDIVIRNVSRPMTLRETFIEFAYKPVHNIYVCLARFAMRLMPSLRPQRPWNRPDYRRPWNGAELDRALHELRENPESPMSSHLTGQYVSPTSSEAPSPASSVEENSCSDHEEAATYINTGVSIPHNPTSYGSIMLPDLPCACAKCGRAK